MYNFILVSSWLLKTWKKKKNNNKNTKSKYQNKYNGPLTMSFFSPDAALQIIMLVSMPTDTNMEESWFHEADMMRAVCP